MSPDRRAVLIAAGSLLITPAARAQPARIPFENANGKIFAPVIVNGQPVQAIVDTGSAFLALDEAFAVTAGVKPSGRRALVRGVQNVLRGRHARIDQIIIGGTELRSMPAIVIDYGDLADSVGRPIEMALGGELLDRYVLDLDFQDESLVFHPRQTFIPPAGIAPTTLSPKAGLMTAPVVFPGGGVVWGIVDTGSNRPLIVSPGPAERLNLLRGRSSTEPLGGIGGATITRVTTTPRLSFGGVAFDDVPVQVTPRSLGVDANIGLGLLARFHVWYDPGGRRMWLKPTGEAAPFRRNLVGVFGEATERGLRVSHVAAASPAAEAGFRVGELIVAINGEPALTANQTLRDNGAGANLTFTLADGTTRRLTLTRYY